MAAENLAAGHSSVVNHFHNWGKWDKGNGCGEPRRTQQFDFKFLIV